MTICRKYSDKCCFGALWMVVGLISTSGSARACGSYQTLKETSQLVQELGEVARGSAASVMQSGRWTTTINALRERGEEGLLAMIDFRDDRAKELGTTDVEEVRQLDLAIDRIASQRFATKSRLFWHTDRESAVAESRRTNRPIISLRMLGRLDENLSCANSRFFRTTLYPDPSIAERLRDRFVLHWESVREVPVVTIDFGNGRHLKQPLTGNSAHLVLDKNGQPFDALPGLVAPQAFVKWLDSTQEFWKANHHSEQSAFWKSVRSYHQRRSVERRKNGTAIAAHQRVADLNPLDKRWTAAGQNMQVLLSSESKTLLKNQRPADAPMLIAATKSIAEVPLLLAVQPIEKPIARDTAFNLLALQTKLDDWFTNSQRAFQYDSLTNRMYAELFLMPLDDPWLGLSPSTVDLALDNGGRTSETSLRATEVQSTSTLSLTQAERRHLQWNQKPLSQPIK